MSPRFHHETVSGVTFQLASVIRQTERISNTFAATFEFWVGERVCLLFRSTSVIRQLLRYMSGNVIPYSFRCVFETNKFAEFNLSAVKFLCQSFTRKVLFPPDSFPKCQNSLLKKHISSAAVIQIGQDILGHSVEVRSCRGQMQIFCKKGQVSACLLIRTVSHSLCLQSE